MNYNPHEIETKWQTRWEEHNVFDSFGLPAENFAIKSGVHPQESTAKNIAFMTEQYRRMGVGGVRLEAHRHLLRVPPPAEDPTAEDPHHEKAPYSVTTEADRELAYRLEYTVLRAGRLLSRKPRERRRSSNPPEYTGTSPATSKALF